MVRRWWVNVLLIWVMVGQGLIALAIGPEGGGCLDIFYRSKINIITIKRKQTLVVVRWCWVNFQFRGVLLIWFGVGQGPTALTVGAGGGYSNMFVSRLSFLFSFSPSGRRPDID